MPFKRCGYENLLSKQICLVPYSVIYVGFAAHKVSSNVTLPIGGGRIAYFVAPSTGRWFWWSRGSVHALANCHWII